MHRLLAIVATLITLAAMAGPATASNGSSERTGPPVERLDDYYVGLIYHDPDQGLAAFVGNSPAEICSLIARGEPVLHLGSALFVRRGDGLHNYRLTATDDLYLYEVPAGATLIDVFVGACLDGVLPEPIAAGTGDLRMFQRNLTEFPMAGQPGTTMRNSVVGKVVDAAGTTHRIKGSASYVVADEMLNPVPGTFRLQLLVH